jgi:redox-sensing transcriptional repressor
VKHVAPSTIRRLSLYLHFLEACAQEGQATVSSRELAEAGGATPAQVRKDLSFFGSFGRRGVGYPVGELATHLQEILGLGRTFRVVLVGAGRLGAALAHFEGFLDRGFRIGAVYDTDASKVGARLDGLVVRGAERLGADLAAEPADIGVIGVPAGSAQEVADALVGAGVQAILNFAPVRLTVPDGVSVKHVNLALELDALAFALRNGSGR